MKKGIIMGILNVFISSTCYDLQDIRDDLRKMIKDMGYTPICSEYSDILYDPQMHTHESCIKAVEESDMLICIIGGRFGGPAHPKAINLLEDEIPYESGDYSITQIECCRAIEKNIPLYVFVKKDVLDDLNKFNHPTAEITSIDFPSIPKKETAEYIFNFINFLRKRQTNNDYFPFNNFDDIATSLKKQWGLYFQRLLREKRTAPSTKKINVDIEKRILTYKDLEDKLKNSASFFKEYTLIYEKIKSFDSHPDSDWYDVSPSFVTNLSVNRTDLKLLRDKYLTMIPEEITDIMSFIEGDLNAIDYEVAEKKIFIPQGLSNEERIEKEFKTEEDVQREYADGLWDYLLKIKSQMKSYIEDLKIQISKA